MTTIHAGRLPTLCALALMAALGLPAGPGLAQGLFAPVAAVNGETLSRYQVDQRSRFLALLNAPNAGFEGARDMLIDELLRVQAARDAGIEVSPTQLDEAMVEFAGRANLTPEQFVSVLEARGIAPETYRDFARNGIYWRLYVQDRFGDRARPSREEVRRAAAGADVVVPDQVLLSEIVLPATPETRAEVRVLADRLSRQIADEDQFEQAARRFSRSPTAARGGRRDWFPTAELPPEVAGPVARLAPGEVSAPIDLGEFVALYLLRAREDAASVGAPSIDYAEYRVPPGPDAAAEIAGVRARVDTCDDLYGVARGAPDRLVREDRLVGQVPADIRQAVAALDPDESTVLQAPNGVLRLVMLCARGAEAPDGALQAAGQQILGERLTGLADAALEELRAGAVIERF